MRTMYFAGRHVQYVVDRAVRVVRGVRVAQPLPREGGLTHRGDRRPDEPHLVTKIVHTQ